MASAGVTVDRQAIDGLIQGLKVAGSAEYLGIRMQLNVIKREALRKLKDEFFPFDETSRHFNREYRGHLRTGWRAFDFRDAGKVGFIFRNTLSDDNPRVSTILSSLDKGSKGYIRELNGKRALSFTGEPGRATRPNASYAPWIFTSRHIYIPARRPVNYIEKTYRYIDDLLASKFPDYVRGLREDMRKWANRD